MRETGRKMASESRLHTPMQLRDCCFVGCGVLLRNAFTLSVADAGASVDAGTDSITIRTFGRDVGGVNGESLAEKNHPRDTPGCFF